MSKNLEDDSYDAEVYLQRARDRKAAEEEALTSRGTSRKLLTARETSLDLNKNAGKRSYVSVEMVGDREVKRGAGFYCEVCQYTCRDSQAYMAHLSSRYHLTNAGFDMRVARASVDQVKDRFKKHSKKRPTPAESLSNKVGERRSGCSGSSRGSSSSSSSSSSCNSGSSSTVGVSEVPVRAPSLKRQKTSMDDNDMSKTKSSSTSNNTTAITKIQDGNVSEASNTASTNTENSEKGEETEEQKFARLMGFSASFK